MHPPVVRHRHRAVPDERRAGQRLGAPAWVLLDAPGERGVARPARPEREDIQRELRPAVRRADPALLGPPPWRFAPDTGQRAVGSTPRVIGAPSARLHAARQARCPERKRSPAPERGALERVRHRQMIPITPPSRRYLRWTRAQHRRFLAERQQPRTRCRRSTIRSQSSSPRSRHDVLHRRASASSARTCHRRSGTTSANSSFTQNDPRLRNAPTAHARPQASTTSPSDDSRITAMAEAAFRDREPAPRAQASRDELSWWSRRYGPSCSIVPRCVPVATTCRRPSRRCGRR